MLWAARLARSLKHRQQPGPVPSLDQEQPADLPHAATAAQAFSVSGTPVHPAVSAPARSVPQRKAEPDLTLPGPATLCGQDPTPAAAVPTSKATSAPTVPRQPLQPLSILQTAPPAGSPTPSPSAGSGQAAPRPQHGWHPVRAAPQVPQLSASFQAHVQRVLSRAQPGLRGPSPPTGLCAKAGNLPLDAEERLPGQQQPQQEPLLAAAVSAGPSQQHQGPSEPGQRLASSRRLGGSCSERQVSSHTIQVKSGYSEQADD